MPRILLSTASIAIVTLSAIFRAFDSTERGEGCVFLGRPFLFAAVAAGEPGVRHAIELLSTEISRDMALLGISDLAEIDPTLIAKIGEIAPSAVVT